MFCEEETIETKQTDSGRISWWVQALYIQNWRVPDLKPSCSADLWEKSLL